MYVPLYSGVHRRDISLGMSRCEPFKNCLVTISSALMMFSARVGAGENVRLLSTTLEPTFISGKWGTMGASRPPHTIADTPRGGPVQSTPAPALWQGQGTVEHAMTTGS